MLANSTETFDLERRRFGTATLPLGVYLMTITLYVGAGLILSAAIASLTYSLQPNWLWLIAYFVVVFPGIMLSAGSGNWLISTLGYLLVVIPSGALLGPFVAQYTLGSILHVAGITVLVTLGLGVAGALYPKSVAHWGGYLLTALLVLIFGQIVEIILVAFGITAGRTNLFDYFGALLFSAYIFYDLNRAVRLVPTMDNAVDMSVALYLDVINLFVKLARLLAKKK